MVRIKQRGREGDCRRRTVTRRGGAIDRSSAPRRRSASRRFRAWFEEPKELGARGEHGGHNQGISGIGEGTTTADNPERRTEAPLHGSAISRATKMGNNRGLEVQGGSQPPTETRHTIFGARDAAGGRGHSRGSFFSDEIRNEARTRT